MIQITCECGHQRLIHAERKLEGPDDNVVVFVADADETCDQCGISLRHLIENEAMAAGVVE